MRCGNLNLLGSLWGLKFSKWDRLCLSSSLLPFGLTLTLQRGSGQLPRWLKTNVSSISFFVSVVFFERFGFAWEDEMLHMCASALCFCLLWRLNFLFVLRLLLLTVLIGELFLLLTALERTSKYLCTCMWLGKAWYGFFPGATVSSDHVASYRWGFIVAWRLICSLQIFFYLSYQHYLKHLRLAPLPFLLGALFILWLFFLYPR